MGIRSSKHRGQDRPAYQAGNLSLDRCRHRGREHLGLNGRSELEQVVRYYHSRTLRSGRLNGNTPLLRQVHPTWVREGHVTSHVFCPTPKDKGCISVYDGDLISPSKAWNHYTTGQRLQSVGVVAVTVGECNAQSLAVYAATQGHFPEHVLVDFNQLPPTKSIPRVAKALRECANVRDWLFHAPAPASP